MQLSWLLFVNVEASNLWHPFSLNTFILFCIYPADGLRKNVPDCGLWRCLVPVQGLFNSTSADSHMHTSHGMLWFNQRVRPPPAPTFSHQRFIRQGSQWFSVSSCIHSLLSSSSLSSAIQTVEVKQNYGWCGRWLLKCVCMLRFVFFQYECVHVVSAGAGKGHWRGEGDKLTVACWCSEKGEELPCVRPRPPSLLCSLSSTGLSLFSTTTPGPAHAICGLWIMSLSLSLCVWVCVEVREREREWDKEYPWTQITMPQPVSLATYQA